MGESMRVSPEALREAARRHPEAADAFAAVPMSHPEIASWVASLGPIGGGMRGALLSLLDQRRACYEGQAQDHLDVAGGLVEAAARWESHDRGAAQEMRELRDR